MAIQSRAGQGRAVRCPESTTGRNHMPADCCNITCQLQKPLIEVKHAEAFAPALLKLQVAIRERLPHSGSDRGCLSQPSLPQPVLKQLLDPRVHNAHPLCGSRHKLACTLGLTAHGKLAHFTFPHASCQCSIAHGKLSHTTFDSALCRCTIVLVPSHGNLNIRTLANASFSQCTVALVSSPSSMYHTCVAAYSIATSAQIWASNRWHLTITKHCTPYSSSQTSSRHCTSIQKEDCWHADEAIVSGCSNQNHSNHQQAGT